MSVLFLAHNTPTEIVSAAKDAGFNVVSLLPAHGMAEPVASHADMLFYAGFGRVFVRSAHSEIAEILRAVTSLPVSLTSDPPSSVYPADTAFDCVMLGGALVGRADAISSAVKRAATESMIPILDVAQGYAKCSTCVLGGADDPTAPIITADINIHRLAQSRCVDATLIPAGGIELPGYGTGFIGGASFYAQGAIYFLGDIIAHAGYDEIKKAASLRGIGIISLSSRPLFDAGCLYLEE